jgi:CMP-N-acetylneuraminic acid synthetase
VIALIPARGGSRRVPRKNLRAAGGKPLIAWTIEAAKHACCVDRVVVSTDDREIADVSRQYGAEIPFLRPAALSTDSATSAAVVKHALRELGVHEASDASFVLLQPTSPLRTSGDIDEAALLLERTAAVVSVTPLLHSLAWIRTLDESGHLRSPAGRFEQRSDLYELNGAIYMMSAGRFFTDYELIPDPAAGYVMPRERSIDIDTEFDLHLCDLLLTTHDGSA